MNVSPHPAPNYRFEGKYAACLPLCKGESELQKLIMAGKIRFTGPMPELMGLAGPLNRIEMVARSFPKTFWVCREEAPPQALGEVRLLALLRLPPAGEGCGQPSVRAELRRVD